VEEVKRRRGRPAKTVEESIAEAPALEIEESAVQAKLRHSKEDRAAAQKLEYVGNKVYHLRPYLTPQGKTDAKLIMVRKKNNGSSYTSYIGRASNQSVFIAKIRSEGLLKE